MVAIKREDFGMIASRYGLTGVLIAGMILFTGLQASSADLTLAVGDEISRESSGTLDRKSYSLRIHNSSADGVSGVKAVVLEATAGITVEEGEVAVAALEGNQYVITADSFTLSVGRGTWNPAQPVTLKWQLEYTDPSGPRQQIVETVSTF
ncbi:MAG: hypothetical protein HY760_00945 [Nitrospirae bacterium]|nr:hypothetical protein [Nitrospirota bacterium]